MTQGSWSTVALRRRGGAVGPGAAFGGPAGRGAAAGGSGGVRRRATAAVAIKSCSDVSHAEILKNARTAANLGGIDINYTRIRRAANGGFLIKVAGPEGHQKADELAGKLGEALQGVASVSRPVMRGQLQITGFDESVSRDEVMAAIVDGGRCREADVRVSPLRQQLNGLLHVWVQCSLTSANRIAAGGSLCLGWSSARVTLMRARPIQCFRCWHFGHVRANCASSVDRGGTCFRCGGSGHLEQTCNEKHHCVICAEFGENANHRIGSERCAGISKRPGGDRRSSNAGVTNGG
ncbi:hypothetical protein DMN91_009172 [Ooceraea biroi]|uniref:CCHC-type domain-containing protein n=1 Tax=Ooceraea biroi TaxID=2015173 RepID=A0A3L8DEE8_OOCBI|nr:hypothetical protein DMN91_009172 [Ooceraea biroi]